MVEKQPQLQATAIVLLRAESGLKCGSYFSVLDRPGREDSERETFSAQLS